MAIYSALGLTPALVGELREQKLLNPAFLIGFVMICAAVALLGFKRWPTLPQIGVV